MPLFCVWLFVLAGTGICLRAWFADWFCLACPLLLVCLVDRKFTSGLLVLPLLLDMSLFVPWIACITLDAWLWFPLLLTIWFLVLCYLFISGICLMLHLVLVLMLPLWMWLCWFYPPCTADGCRIGPYCMICLLGLNVTGMLDTVVGSDTFLSLCEFSMACVCDTSLFFLGYLVLIDTGTTYDPCCPSLTSDTILYCCYLALLGIFCLPLLVLNLV
jgi:hypothetical protein